MQTLYYSPGACSMAVHVLLNELNIPFERKLVDLGTGGNQDPEFLKLNPRGQVPVLVNDGLVIRESAAIMMYLIDEYQSNLLPRSGRPRTMALEWLEFANATLHPAYSTASFIVKNTADGAAKDELFAAALAKINKLWDEVEAVLAKNRYICGSSITAADILISVIANWGSSYPKRPTLGEHTKRMLRDIISRPAYTKAIKAEQLDYQAAA